MADREKVIKAWEIFRDSNPYEICDGREFRAIKEPEYCMGQMIEDTMALLKEQQPRVLTIEETINAEYPIDVFAEVKEENRIFAVTAPIIFDWVLEPNIRFWTARPTDEQRKAVPWETH